MASVTVVMTIASVWLCLLLRGSCGQGTSLNIIPNTFNESHFLGEDFERTCRVTSDEEVTYQWLLNGDMVESAAGYLLLLPVGFEHIGEYFCQATLTNGSVIGPVSGGFLHVLDPSRIIAPHIQYALLGSSITLQCETDLPDTSINWVRVQDGETMITPTAITIDPVSLEDGGTYTCRLRVNSEGTSASTTRDIELMIIVPPVITRMPDNYTQHSGPSQLTLEVTFRSRLFENTTAAWSRDAVPIPENQIQTVPVNDSHGTTTLSFPSTSRNNSGVYWVVIENNSPFIPEEMRRAVVTFQLRILILPTLPTDLQVTEYPSPTMARVTWILANQNAEDAADSLALTVSRPAPGENDGVIPLAGTATKAVVTVLPGTEYTISITAHNQDGHRSTEPAVEFVTPASEPSVSSIDVVRVNQTAFRVTVTVDYTGGGAITHFTVTFRKSGSGDDFNRLGEIPASPASPQSTLVWNGAVTSAEFASLELLEFTVTVTNDRSLSTTLDAVQETIVPPGAPLRPTLVSSNTTSLTIAVQLSQIGTPPILFVRLTINGPAGFSTEQNSTGGFIFSGETVQLTVGGLSADTEYQVEALAVNRAGPGPSSEAMLLRTRPSPSLPLWVIVVIIVGSVVAVAVLLMVVCMGCCIRRRRNNSRGEKTIYADGNTYGTPTSEEKKLDSSHEILTRQYKGFTALSGGPLTPRSPTTLTTPATVISAEDIDEGPLGSKFKFETSSNNSDDSDTTFPRYTYRVSPSPGESVPSLTVRTSCTSDTLLSPPPHPSYATDV